MGRYVIPIVPTLLITVRCSIPMVIQSNKNGQDMRRMQKSMVNDFFDMPQWYNNGTLTEHYEFWTLAKVSFPTINFLKMNLQFCNIFSYIKKYNQHPDQNLSPQQRTQLNLWHLWKKATLFLNQNKPADTAGWRHTGNVIAPAPVIHSGGCKGQNRAKWYKASKFDILVPFWRLNFFRTG